MEQTTIDTQYVNVDDKKLDEKYLLQINRIKLGDYIGCGLVIPDIYLGEACEADVQSKNKNFLVVADGYLKDLDEQQILLELILTDDEKKKLDKVEDSHYFDFPLPITRIKKVYVQNTAIKKHMEVQIRNSENGFLPKELFSVYTNKGKIKFNRKSYSALDETLQANNYENKMRCFDKRMGMFSFMKNTNNYYHDSVGIVSDYSNHYFDTLSTLLKEPISDGHFKDLDVLKKSKSFKDLLYTDKQIDNDFISTISKECQDSEIKEIFLNITKPTGTREVLSKLLEKDSLLYYLIGLVYHFRQKNNSNRKDNFKIDIKNLIPYEVAEVSLAILGLYFGYKSIRSEEKIELEDKYFKKIFGHNFNMKFNFESKLDYITVETIYDICFKEHKGYEYDYLPYPAKKPPSLKIPTDANFKIWYQVQKKAYFDIDQITVKKLSILEMFTGLLGKYSDEIIENRQTRYLIPFVQYTFGDILTFNDRGQRYFKKDDLLKKLEIKEDKKIINELIDVLSIGKN